MRYKGVIINKAYYCNFVKITFETKSISFVLTLGFTVGKNNKKYFY